MKSRATIFLSRLQKEFSCACFCRTLPLSLYSSVHVNTFHPLWIKELSQHNQSYNGVMLFSHWQAALIRVLWDHHRNYKFSTRGVIQKHVTTAITWDRCTTSSGQIITGLKSRRGNQSLYWVDDGQVESEREGGSGSFCPPVLLWQSSPLHSFAISMSAWAVQWGSPNPLLFFFSFRCHSFLLLQAALKGLLVESSRRTGLHAWQDLQLLHIS